MSLENRILEIGLAHNQAMYLYDLQHKATVRKLTDGQFNEMLHHQLYQYCDGCEYCAGRISGSEPLEKWHEANRVIWRELK